MKLKWIRSNKGLANEHTTLVNDFKVDRVTCTSGTKHYYVHYYCPIRQYWHMSHVMRSFQTVRKFIRSIESRGMVPRYVS